MSELADQETRERALDPRLSCIVQAPAGSGKTGLLTQRYLRLLACVAAPEEIIAITFTRKAAGEMRSRILQALADAAGEAPPEAHRRRTWELARVARARDTERGWRLAEHPTRLRIQTIDSLNAELTRQMPLLSGFGAPPVIAEQPEILYQEAARRTLELLEHGDAGQSDALATLLQHLDNDLPRAVRLLADMLPRRDQWLRHTGGDGSAQRRLELQQAFRREIVHQLHMAQALIPADLQTELAELARFAARSLTAQGGDSALNICVDLSAFPDSTFEALPAWQGMVELLLTHSHGDAWRKTVNKNNGFDAQHPDEKVRMQEVLQRLSELPGLHAVLRRIRGLPGVALADTQWRVLDALLRLLPLSVAQLQLLFAERGEVDYAEVALRALAALGTPEAPTDLALTLDYRIQHLLVDEFQDTSFNQFLLLERLTEGWQPGDGRTLFLVGDPMQSIYRFREADVGLFLRAQRYGIGQVGLTPLTLSVNFRACPELVQWINDGFSRLFPPHADIVSGALGYCACHAARPASGAAAVRVHAAFDADAEREAGEVIALIRAARAQLQRVAVLVRGRNHLVALVPRLRREGLRFRAMELEMLGERPVVRDLVSVTRALLHDGDRSAWLAVLRAPWCGLSLADLCVLTAGDQQQTMPELLADETRYAALSADGAARLRRVGAVLRHAVAERRRGSLREQVEQAWLKLGGPGVLGSLEDLDDAEAFLSLLETLDAGGTLTNTAALESALGQLFARPDPEAGDELQVMTIHKAKGLEFDVVIVPGLGAGGGRSQRPLLLHLERTRAQGLPDLLLAPLNASGSDRDPYYELVLQLRQEQENFERQRLLYVAATRAREQLHLLGYAGYSEKGGQRELKTPSVNSLLKTLWPVVESEYRRSLDSYACPVTGARVAPPVARLRRVPANWQLPAPPSDLIWHGTGHLAAPPPPRVEFDWAGDTLRHVGTVVHRLLQQIGNAAGDVLEAEHAARHAGRIRAWLQQAGVPANELDPAVQTVFEAVDHMLADDTGRAILAARGSEARCEYALSGFEDGRLVTGVMDRCFVDHDGVRWIVDYKTSRHEGTDRAAFLAREAERYRSQLRRYARLMRAHEDRPLKIGLYFPLLGVFHAVDVDQV